MITTIILFIVILSILVFVHEMGHFMTARFFGVKAEEFGFGFPPRAWGIFKTKEGKWKNVKGAKQVEEEVPGTIYSVNWVPLGGFVKIKGENGEDEGPESFASKKIWQRAIILLAGVTMNIVLAAVLISFGYMIGLPQALGDDISSMAKIENEQIQIVQVLTNTPAQAANIKMGDVINNINGVEFAKYEELQAFVAERTGEELIYNIKRGDEVMNINVVPAIIEETGVGGIGVAIAETGIVSYPWYLSIWEGIATTIFTTWAIIVAFYDLLKGIFIGQGVSADIAGPIGIAALTGQVAKMGFIYILQFTAILSINLAIINAFPFPALDGGRILFLIIEKLKGSPVKREIEAVVHNVGFALLMLLVLVVTFKDVARFGSTFRALWEKIAG